LLLIDAARKRFVGLDINASIPVDLKSATRAPNGKNAQTQASLLTIRCFLLDESVVHRILSVRQLNLYTNCVTSGEFHG
jgi:hypothetical protein